MHVANSKIVFASACLMLVTVCLGQDKNTSAVRLLDEFGRIHYGDASARMAYVAALLAEEPNLRVYIVAYAGRDDYPGLSHRFAHRLRNYLVSHAPERGYAPSRIVAVDGGRREKLEVQIWLAPDGEQPPAPTPALPEVGAGMTYKFDQYPINFPEDEDFDAWDGRYEDEAARLDAFAAALKRNPDSKGYIVARAQGVYVYRPSGKRLHGGKRLYTLVRSRKLSDPTGTDAKLARAERTYLVEEHAIEPSRIVAFGRGYNSAPRPPSEALKPEDSFGRIYVARTVELWVVPRGSPGPLESKR